MSQPGLAPRSVAATVELAVGRRKLSGRMSRPVRGTVTRGVVVALHGTGYSSAYFDSVPDSLLNLGAALGYCVVALDRPRTGETAEKGCSSDEQIEIVSGAIAALPTLDVDCESGIFLAGHSSGGMLALLVACDSDLPIVGVSMTAASGAPNWPVMNAVADAAAGAGAFLELPAAARQQTMMGPAWTFAPDVAVVDPVRDISMPTVEIQDVLAWSERMPRVAGTCAVPVQCVMPEFDAVWSVDDATVEAVRRQFSASPMVDVHIQRIAGHSVELHAVAFAHCLKILAFAQECHVHARVRHSRL